MNSDHVESTVSQPASGIERREKLHNTIASLIKHRQAVMTSYCTLAGVSTFAMRDMETLRPQVAELRGFCQVMVDYTAMGHFEIYQRIIEGKERRRAVKEVAAEIYPAIAETTDFLVDFNDKYDDLESTVVEPLALAEELPKLGEIIAIRGELEDQILAALQR